MKIKEISERDHISSILIASGYTTEEVAELTQFLDAPVGSLSAQEELINSRRLEMAETLSCDWIVSNLRRLAISNDHQAAVSAMALLVRISQGKRVLFKP